MKEKVYSIYLFTFPNNKKYCGYTSQSPKKRWHSGHGYDKCPLVHRAIVKYGWSNIKKEILYTFDNEEEALAKEKEIIATMQLTNPNYGYNLHEGGKPTGSIAFLTEEGRKRISESNKRLWATPEYREKMAKRNCHKLTREDIQKGIEASRLAHLGTTPINAKPVLQIDKDTDEVIAEFPSGGQAAKAIGKTMAEASNILRTCRGKGKTAYGYKWRFKENDNTQS